MKGSITGTRIEGAQAGAVCSHHPSCAGARRAARKRNEAEGGPYVYRVEKAERGPWRWRVVCFRESDDARRRAARA